MDKYEYNIKADQIMKLIDRRDFKTAAKIADGIDWRRVRNINMLTNVGCVYQAVGRYTDAKEIFELARNRAPLGRRLVYQMADVCIDAGEFEEAERYIQEFSELAPKDTGRFELLYQLSRRKGEPIENQIAILEEFKKQDFDEKWTFELAKLYHKAGYAQKCIAACDELILWFGEGQYVDKAMELKMLYVPLSPSQQEKYNMRFKKEDSAEPAAPVVKKQRETEPVPELKTVSYNQEMYNTENLQAALAKSMQEIMEAEERYKASFPASQSRMAEYQSEQEEREAMFAATRDMRKERQKFKQMVTETDLPFMAAIDLSGATVMDNILIQESEEEAAQLPEENGILEETLEPVQENPDIEASEEAAEHFRQEEETAETLEEESEKIEVPEELQESFAEEASEVSEEVFEEFPEEEASEEFSEEMEEFYYQIPEMEEEEELEEEAEEEEPEYEEVPFSLRELDEDEIPAEVYYCIPEYNPQPYLDKAAGRLAEEEQAEEEPEEAEEAEKTEEIKENEEPELSAEREEDEEIEAEDAENEPIEEADEAEELETVLQQMEPEELELEEESEEQPDFEEALEETEDYETEEEFSDEEPEDSDEELEESEEDFFMDMMTRSYGIEELPDYVYYQIPGYMNKAYEEEQQEAVQAQADAAEKEALKAEKKNAAPEKVIEPDTIEPEAFETETFEPEASESEEEDEEENSEYIYGVEELPQGAYYQVPGYNPTAFLMGRTGSQEIKAEPKQQTKIQKQPQKAAEQETYQDDIPEEEPDAETEQPQEVEEAVLELTPEYRNVFANYLHMPGVEQQIAEILYETEQIGEEKETSLFGNVLVMGEVKSGKTTLAVSLIKTMNHLNGRKGRKIAKISGDRLNNKGIRDSISRLAGADLIIEHAGEMRVSTVTELLEAMGDYTGGMIVILEDTRASIERLLADVPQIGIRFTHSIELKECNIAEWAEAARKYAEENYYTVDDMAMLALSAKIDGVYANKKNVTMEDVKEIIDDAVIKAEKRNKKIFGRIFSKKKDSELVVLRENDFN